MRLDRSDLELEVLVNRIEREELDLQPEYQRGEVWDRDRRQRLIDTILRDWYIPAIHIVIDDDLGKEFVLDGQQRLKTIAAFFNNELRISGSVEPLRSDLQDLNGLTFNELPPAVRMRVRRFKITVVTLDDYQPEEPSELFFRLNQQYALTPPEKRNALFGKARDAVRGIVQELMTSNTFTPRTVGFSNGRLAYDDVISRFCVALTNGTYRINVRNVDVERFYRRDTFPEEVISRTLTAGRLLGQGLNDVGGVKLNKATLFTWLAFADFLSEHRTPEFPSWYLQEFETLRRAPTGNTGLADIDTKARHLVQIYSDRASYRVLDVASVILRDIAVHGVFAILGKPIGVEYELHQFLASRDVTEIDEHSLMRFSEVAEWGKNR